MPTASRGIFRSLFAGVAILEDFADRLNHIWTVWFMIIVAALIWWRQQLFNVPIVCFTPAQFTAAQVAYAHSACWRSTQKYYYPMMEQFPVMKREEWKIWCYKWLPITLFIQALLFKLPSIVMYVLHNYSGISFEKLASLTEGNRNLNLIERYYLGKQIGRYVYNWCKQCENCFPWRMLSISWLLVKILFCVNALVQFVLVDKMLSTRNPPHDNSTSYGDVIYANLFSRNSTEWKPSPIFPRTVLCDYGVKQFDNFHMFTVQCDIPANEFNEYAYMLVWISLLIVTVINWLSFVAWLLLSLVPFTRERYITKMLELSEELNASQLNAQEVNRFVSMVGEDGVMVLKLISSNSSEFIVRDAVTTMYQMRMAHRYPHNVPGQSSQGAPLLASGTGVTEVAATSYHDKM